MRKLTNEQTWWINTAPLFEQMARTIEFGNTQSNGVTRRPIL